MHRSSSFTERLFPLYEPRAFAVSKLSGRGRFGIRVVKGSEATTWPETRCCTYRTVVCHTDAADNAGLPAVQAAAAATSATHPASAAASLPHIDGTDGRDCSGPGGEGDESCLQLMLTHRSVSCLSDRGQSRPPSPPVVQQAGGSRILPQPPPHPPPTTGVGRRERRRVGGGFEPSDRHGAAMACSAYVSAERTALSFLKHPHNFMKREANRAESRRARMRAAVS